MQMISLEQELKQNAYPGRGIVIGQSANGKYEFEITSPNTFVAFVLIPCALAMFGLHPVARTLAPISVPKNQ